MRHIHFVQYRVEVAGYQDMRYPVDEFFHDWLLLPAQITIKVWLGDQELIFDGRDAFWQWYQDNPVLLYYHMTKFWSSYTNTLEVCEAPCETMWELAE